MLRLSNISSLKQLYYSLYSRFVSYPTFLWQIKKTTIGHQDQEPNRPLIHKITIEDFSQKSCLIRWGEAYDREFGGSSFGTVGYD
jgi:hypothetical protein